MMHDSAERSKRHFDATAANYDASHDGKFCADMYAPLVEALRGVGGGRLLDLGCGNGNLLALLAGSGFALTGVDLSEAMIDQARRRLGGRAALVVADARSLPLSPDREPPAQLVVMIV